MLSIGKLRQLSLVVSIQETEKLYPILTSCGFGTALGSTESKYLEIFGEVWVFHFS